MTYLIDTDVLIGFAHNKEPAVRAVEATVPEGVALSVISFAEYLRGVYVSRQGTRERELLDQFIRLAGASVLPVYERIAEQYGAIQADLMKRGLKGNNFDVMIAATALVHDLTLVTGNRKDFEKIEGLQLYEMGSVGRVVVASSATNEPRTHW